MLVQEVVTVQLNESSVMALKTVDEYGNTCEWIKATEVLLMFEKILRQFSAISFTNETANFGCKLQVCETINELKLLDDELVERKKKDHFVSIFFLRI